MWPTNIFSILRPHSHSTPERESPGINPSGFPLPEAHCQPLREDRRQGPVFGPSPDMWLESPGAHRLQEGQLGGVQASPRPQSLFTSPPPLPRTRRVPVRAPRSTARVHRPWSRSPGPGRVQRGRGQRQAGPREAAAGSAQPAHAHLGPRRGSGGTSGKPGAARALAAGERQAAAGRGRMRGGAGTEARAPIGHPRCPASPAPPWCYRGYLSPVASGSVIHPSFSAFVWFSLNRRLLRS